MKPMTYHDQLRHPTLMFKAMRENLQTSCVAKPFPLQHTINTHRVGLMPIEDPGELNIYSPQQC